MNKKMKYAAELGVLYSVCIMTGATDNSRLSGLQRKLNKSVAPTYSQLLRSMSKDETNKLAMLIAQWGKDTGWLNNKKTVGTVLCFCAEMIDRSENTFPTKCIEIITDIIDHLNQKKKVYGLSLSAGTIAADKWDKLFNV